MLFSGSRAWPTARVSDLCRCRCSGKTRIESVESCASDASCSVIIVLASRLLQLQGQAEMGNIFARNDRSNYQCDEYNEHDKIEYRVADHPAFA